MGRIICCGLGPGDPDLMSVRADREIRAARQIAYFRKKGRPGQARRIVEGILPRDVSEYPMEYPVTTELAFDSDEYVRLLADFYDECAEHLARLASVAKVVVLCEGDPYFYGSFMHLHARLQGRVAIEVIAGIPGMAGCWNSVGQPIALGDDVTTVLMGTLAEDELERRMRNSDALVIMKTGRNLQKVRRALVSADRLADAWLVERGTMPDERIARVRLRDLRDNYGHLGPALMAYAVPRYTEIKQRIIDRQIEIDTAFGIEPHERYWSAVPAVAEVICEICNDLGLLFYPVAGLRAWFAQQLGTMRTIVKAEYATPLMIMTDFIDQIHSNIIVVTQEAVIFGNGSQRDASTIQTPHGPLLGHYQQPAGQLALRRRGFRDHCARIGANANQVLDALHKDGVVVEREVKRTIGAGTCYAKTQSWCFVIDMTHPDIAATLDYSPGISPRKTGLRIVGD